MAGRTAARRAAGRAPSRDSRGAPDWRAVRKGGCGGSLRAAHEAETAHELAGLQRHGLVACAPRRTVILPAERHAALIKGEQTLVGDGHAVRVARQVGEHRFRSRKGALGVHKPLAGPQRCQPLRKGGAIGERRILAKELQLAAPVGIGERFKEATPEQAREHAHRQEEAGTAGNPAPAVGRQPPPGTMPCTCG
ncbi:hypothetical protein OKW43_000140 [Paraburkholderia sp. WC7.3g]